MNNAKYYNSSLAHDFELFTVKEKDKNTPPLKIAKSKSNIIKMNSPSRKYRKKSALFPVLCCITILFILCSIFLKSQINETYNEINNIQKKIESTKAEIIELECKIKSEISYENLEKEATKLGMKKVEKSQVHYIKTNKKDIAIVDGKKIVSNTP